MSEQPKQISDIVYVKTKGFFSNLNPLYLFGGCILLMIVLYFLFFSPSQYKKENKRLKSEIESIQKERNLIKDSITLLKKEYKVLEDSSSLKRKEIEEINKKLDLIQNQISNSFTQLNGIRSSVNDLKTKIKITTEKPANRVGNDLLNSLKSKIKE